MDKQGYEQLDRIEQLQQQTHYNTQLQLELDVIDIIKEFIEKEIKDQNGQLHHLNNDTKINEYYKSLNEKETTEQDEYTQTNEIK